MADLISWVIIIFANLFSILLGIYCIYQVIVALINRKDLMKYQGYLINGFLMIFVMPLFITFGGLKIVELRDEGRPQIGIEFDGEVGTQGNVRFSSSSYEINNDGQEVDLKVENELDEEKNSI